MRKVYPPSGPAIARLARLPVEPELRLAREERLGKPQRAKVGEFSRSSKKKCEKFTRLGRKGLTLNSTSKYRIRDFNLSIWTFSGVLKDWGLDSSDRLCVALDGLLDVLDCLGREELLSCLLTNTSGDMFHNVEFAVVFNRISYSCLDHCFFHDKSPPSKFLFSDLVLNPQARIRFVKRNQFDQLATGVATLQVQWPPCKSEPKDQATRTVLIIRIILNNLRPVAYCLFNFCHADFSNNTLINCMLREFVFSSRDFLSNVIQHSHNSCNITMFMLIASICYIRHYYHISIRRFDFVEYRKIWLL